ncbi:MAG: hypothetical protein QXU18_15730 [Thermoplasmatales archaeon]
MQKPKEKCWKASNVRISYSECDAQAGYFEMPDRDVEGYLIIKKKDLGK